MQTPLTLDLGQLQQLLSALFWPFVRIGSCMMVAPVFGATAVPGRVRIVLAAATAALIAPLVPAASAVTPFSVAGCLVTGEQIVIGVALGLCLQLCFDAVSLGGQMLANSMGLSFALNLDPQRGSGSSTPAVGQLYSLLVTLTFLALNGPLRFVETLVQSFTTLPVAGTGFTALHLEAVARFGSTLFSGALSVALPGITALIVVQLAFGVMSRAAPALNLFAVGLPVSLLCGLLVVLAGLVAVQATFIHSLQNAFRMLGVLIGAPG